jgi:hypothetical protein
VTLLPLYESKDGLACMCQTHKQIVLTFGVTVYATSPLIGSSDAMLTRCARRASMLSFPHLLQWW